jgi:protein phosphatase
VIALRWGAATDVGRRRSNNQDSMLAVDGLFAVADGMGGHAGGEVASLTAVEAMRANFKGGTPDELVAAVVAANRAVLERAEGDAGLEGMGTTMCAVAPVHVDDEDRIAVVNIGDSRVYLLRGTELTQLTEDHSLPEELLRAGELTAEQAAVDPRRNIVTRSLGQFDHVDPDVWDLVPYKGDRLLLCSDGLTNEVTDADIASVLRRHAEPDAAATELVRRANEGGGRDNITVVVVDVVDDDDAAGRASQTLADEPAPMRRSSRALTPEQRDAQQQAATVTASRRNVEDGDAAVAPRRRTLTWRMAAFVVILLMLAGAAAGAVTWYARGAYFVGLDDDRVTIFKGRPGGFLWFDPTIEQRTGLGLDDVLPVRREAIEDGKEEATLEAARRYVTNLREEATTTALTTTTSTTSTTTPVAAP